MKLEIISLLLIFFSVITIILGIIKIHTYPGKIAEAEKPSAKRCNRSHFASGLVDFSILDGGFDMGILRCHSGQSL